MFKAEVITLGNGNVRAKLVGHRITHNEYSISFVSNTKVRCPKCKRGNLFIGEDCLECEICGFAITCLNENQNYCEYCGSSYLSVNNDSGIALCNICKHETDIQNQEKPTTEHVHLTTRECVLCGKSFVDSKKTQLCPSCEYVESNSMASQSNADFLSTKDDLGFTDEFGGYHHYDE